MSSVTKGLMTKATAKRVRAFAHDPCATVDNDEDGEEVNSYAKRSHHSTASGMVTPHVHAVAVQAGSSDGSLHSTYRCSSPCPSTSSSPLPFRPYDISPPPAIPFTLAEVCVLRPAPAAQKLMYDTMTFDELPMDVEYEYENISPVVRHEIEGHFLDHHKSKVLFDSEICRLFSGLNITAGLGVMNFVRSSSQAVGEVEMRQFLYEDLSQTISFITKF